ncbi:MAG: acetoin utilization protein AcuB [Marivirga sp.]|jgi:acetoin utilization protein AcuB
MLDLINDMIPPLKITDEASKALIWMDELRLDYLPVVENQKFQGFLSEDNIIDENDNSKDVGEYFIDGANCFIYQYQHIYDAVKKATDYDFKMVAVLNDDGTYKGVLLLTDLLSVFSQSAFIQSPGGIIVLSLNQIDYSLSEISRLIETNDAQILGSSINIDPSDPAKFRLTLKINREDVTHIIATLERFDYKVVAKYHEATTVTNEKERLDLLLRYLDS